MYPTQYTVPSRSGKAVSEESRYPLWHPNTDMERFKQLGITMVEGEGIYVRDQDGREYISATSGLWNVSLGFRHPDVMRAITEQLGRLPYGTLFRYGNEPAQMLARRLVEVAPPGLTRAFFTTSGSGANEIALKVARGYHHMLGRPHKQLVVTFSHSYHGTLYGSMAVSGENLEQHKYGVDLGKTRTIPTPGRRRCGCCGEEPEYSVDCVPELVELIEKEGEHVAAIIFEPVLGSGGVIVPPQRFFDSLVPLCREHKILLIADEVATGFGRTGKMFACEHFGLEPDVMTLSKGINSGYLPLGATMFREEIFEAFARSRTILTGETQSGNPASCAAALATLDVLERDGLVENAHSVGEYLLRALRGLEEYRHVAEVRGMGLMVGVELCRDKEERAAATPNDVMLTVELLQREGLLVHPAPHGISLFPPLVVTREDADDIADVLHRVLGRLYLR